MINIKTFTSPDPFDPTSPVKYTIAATVTSMQDLVSTQIVSEIVSRIAEKFVEDHYAEIEKLIDIKVVAAITSASAGAAVEKTLMKEVDRIQEIANEALRKSKRRI